MHTDHTLGFNIRSPCHHNMLIRLLTWSECLWEEHRIGKPPGGGLRVIRVNGWKILTRIVQIQDTSFGLPSRHSGESQMAGCYEYDKFPGTIKPKNFFATGWMTISFSSTSEKLPSFVGKKVKCNSCYVRREHEMQTVTWPVVQKCTICTDRHL